MSSQALQPVWDVKAPPNLPGKELSRGDLKDLANSGISEEFAKRALLRRVDSLTGKALLGFQDHADYSGILFPYIWPGDRHVRSYRIRRDRPEIENGKLSRKYVTAPGERNLLYIPPGTAADWLSDTTLPILFTEGEKKGIALSELGWFASSDAAEKPAWLPIAIPGVENWRGRKGKKSGTKGERLDERGPIPDLSRITWDGRTVTIVFDANVHSNDRVRFARYALSEHLRSCGAHVLFLDIPADAGVNGIDDLSGLWGPDRVCELISEKAYDPKFKNWPYKLSEEGVFWSKVDSNGAVEDVRLSARIEVMARTRDASGTNHGRLLSWTDLDGRKHEWAMPMELLASPDAADLRRKLLNEGLSYIAPGSSLHARLAQYLQTAPTRERILCVERVGWHDGAYVLPDQSIGPKTSERVLYQPSSGDSANLWSIRGRVDDWRECIGIPCLGNSRLLLAASCSFAGPLLSLLGFESGGIHLLGGTSIGKTTALRVAASVCGGKEFLGTWRATANGLEASAAAHNDAVMLLDELGQLADPRRAGEIAYLLANGQGTSRMTREITARKRLSWTLLFLSTGEISLSELAAAENSTNRIKGGVDVRLLDVPADAGRGMGIFEDTHQYGSAKAFADHLRSATMCYHGSIFREYIRQLTGTREDSERLVRSLVRDFSVNNRLQNASAEVKRASDRFALIGAAGELATSFGLTGWTKDAAIDAARTCYESWLTQRGTQGSADLHRGLSQVRVFFERHGSSRFQDLNKANLNREEAEIRDRAGYKRLNHQSGGVEFLVLPETFKQEICKGFRYQDIAHELERIGLLERQLPSLMYKAGKLPGTTDTWVFLIRGAIIGGSASD